MGRIKRDSVNSICKKYKIVLEDIQEVYNSQIVKSIINDLLYGDRKSFDNSPPNIKAAVEIRLNR